MLKSRAIETTLGISNSRSLTQGIGCTGDGKLKSQKGNETIHRLVLAGGSSCLWQDGGTPSEPPHCGHPDGNRTREGPAQQELGSWRAGPVPMESSTVEEMQPLPEKTHTPKAERNGEIPWLLACVLQCSPSREPCQDWGGVWEMWSVGRRHAIEAESKQALKGAITTLRCRRSWEPSSMDVQKPHCTESPGGSAVQAAVSLQGSIPQHCSGQRWWSVIPTPKRELFLLSDIGLSS